MNAARLIRAARRARRLSQRELAAFTGVPAGTIARAEAGTNEPRLSTFATIMVALGYQLILVDWRGRVLEVDEVREHFRDRSGRLFPAHLRSGRTPAYGDDEYWWGYHRVAWTVQDAPRYTYWRRDPITMHPIGTNYGHDELWSDAT